MADRPPLVAVLAAGLSSRFGGAKLDAECAGARLGRWALDAVAAAGLEPGIIVVPSSAPQFARESAWLCIANPDAEDGLGGSLALAARYAQAEGRSLLVMLADMPLVSAGHLAALASAGGLAATAYPGGRTGVPACFPEEWLTGLSELSGDEGAGAILSRAEGVRRLAVPPAMLLDVDTPDDLATAEMLLS